MRLTATVRPLEPSFPVENPRREIFGGYIAEIKPLRPLACPEGYSIYGPQAPNILAPESDSVM